MERGSVPDEALFSSLRRRVISPTPGRKTRTEPCRNSGVKGRKEGGKEGRKGAREGGREGVPEQGLGFWRQIHRCRRRESIFEVACV